jgi:hypothetical protein
MIGSVLQELIEKVAIGSVYLHSVKTGELRVLCALAEGFNDAGKLSCLKRAWRHVI